MKKRRNKRWQWWKPERSWSCCNRGSWPKSACWTATTLWWHDCSRWSSARTVGSALSPAGKRLSGSYCMILVPDPGLYPPYPCSSVPPLWSRCCSRCTSRCPNIHSTIHFNLFLKVVKKKQIFRWNLRYLFRSEQCWKCSVWWIRKESRNLWCLIVSILFLSHPRLIHCYHTRTLSGIS